MFEVREIIRSKFTGERMQVKRIAGEIMTCYMIDQPEQYHRSKGMEKPIGIISFCNALKEEPQLKLF